MRTAVIFLLMIVLRSSFGLAQPAYNSCFNALEVCPNQVYSVNNLNANVTGCVNCEDDFNYCFTTDNSIWFTFTTNATGGNVQIDFSNLVFENNPGQDNELQAVVIQATTPCDAGSYTQIGPCFSNETGNFSINTGALPGLTTYYIVVDGDNNGAGITSAAECSFDLSLSGPGIDRTASTASITESSTSICLNEAVTFTCALTDCPDTSDFQWFINGNLVATTTDPFYQTTELQDGDQVSVQTSCYTNCPEVVTDVSQAISVFTINMDAGDDIIINPGESALLAGATTAPVYYWAPAFLLSDPNSFSPLAFPTETTTFTFTAEQNGCVLHDYMTVIVSDQLEVPNTFSPNGDEQNDTWVIDGIENYPNNIVTIYTRWGQKIFETSGYSELKTWDGTSNTGNAPEGVYFYVINLNNGGDPVTGSVTLIR